LNIFEYFEGEFEKIKRNEGETFLKDYDVEKELKKVYIKENNIFAILKAKNINFEECDFNFECYGDYFYYNVQNNDATFDFDIYTKGDNVIFAIFTETEIFSKYAKYNNYQSKYKTKSLLRGGSFIQSSTIIFEDQSIFIKEEYEYGHELIRISIGSFEYALKCENDPELINIYNNAIKEIQPNFEEHLKALIGKPRKMDLGEK